MAKTKHIAGFRLPAIPYKKIHRPKKGKGAYHRPREKQKVRSIIREESRLR